MNRCTLTKLAGSAATVAALQQWRGTQAGAQSEVATPAGSGHIGILVFSGMTVLDLR